jgi:hypothetical protein
LRHPFFEFGLVSPYSPLKDTDFLSQFILYGTYLVLHSADAVLDVIIEFRFEVIYVRLDVIYVLLEFLLSVINFRLEFLLEFLLSVVNFRLDFLLEFLLARLQFPKKSDKQL